MDVKVVMTIAGSDSGGGAGIQADLKTISVMGCYGVTVITALTAQNSMGVQAVHTPPPSFVAQQLSSVMEDFRPVAAKTGMLATAEIIGVVAGSLEAAGLSTLVVDPVMVSATGHSLIDGEASRVLVEKLFPLAALVTPNLHEASALLGRTVSEAGQMEAAARDLHSMGARGVLLKGGHLKHSAADYFFDGERGEFLDSPRIDTPNTHGSGCTLASAVASLLGLGFGMREAVGRAKEFITRAIAGSYRVGRGPGPVNPLAGGRIPYLDGRSG